MHEKAYYTTTDISAICGASTTTIKIIAKKFAETIVIFGAKQKNEWRFNLREMSSIKYVIDSGNGRQDDAIETALSLFFGIDCKRNYERL